MALYLRAKGKKVWQMSFFVNGRQIRRSTGTTNEKLAEKIHAKVLTQITEDKWFDKPKDEKKSVDEMIDKYLSEYSILKTPNGEARDQSIAKNLRKFFRGLLLKAVSPATIVQYKAFRRKKPVKPATLERELCFLKRAFNLAVYEWEWIEKNPVARISKEKFNNEVERWLSFDEEKSLLNSCSEPLKSIVIIALNTGMRQHEILDLEWQNVDLSRKIATIIRSKNGEIRSIPLNHRAFNVLCSGANLRPLKSKYVFSSSAGTRIERRNLLRDFYKARKKAKLENFRFHDLRHTFATRLVQAGIDIYTVSKLLGHKDIRMTQRYSHHCPESLRSSVEVLDTSTNIAHRDIERFQLVFN